MIPFSLTRLPSPQPSHSHSFVLFTCQPCPVHEKRTTKKSAKAWNETVPMILFPWNNWWKSSLSPATLVPPLLPKHTLVWIECVDRLKHDVEFMFRKQVAPKTYIRNPRVVAFSTVELRALCMKVRPTFRPQSRGYRGGDINIWSSFLASGIKWTT